MTLANGVLVNSLSVNGGGRAAIAATSLTGTETLNAVAITGGAAGCNSHEPGRHLQHGGGSITGVTAGADVLMSGGTGTVTSAPPSSTPAAGRLTSRIAPPAQ